MTWTPDIKDSDLGTIIPILGGLAVGISVFFHIGYFSVVGLPLLGLFTLQDLAMNTLLFLPFSLAGIILIAYLRDRNVISKTPMKERKAKLRSLFYLFGFCLALSVNVYFNAGTRWWAIPTIITGLNIAVLSGISFVSDPGRRIRMVRLVGVVIYLVWAVFLGAETASEEKALTHTRWLVRFESEVICANVLRYAGDSVVLRNLDGALLVRRRADIIELKEERRQRSTMQEWQCRFGAWAPSLNWL